MKVIIDELEYIKIKNFSSAKDNVNRIRSQATKWEKIFPKNIPYKEILQKKRERNMTQNILSLKIQ